MPNKRYTSSLTTINRMWLIVFITFWTTPSSFCKESSTAVTNACIEDDLVEILAKIQVINPETVMKLAFMKNLDVSCKSTEDSLGEIDDYYKVCTKPKKSDLYYQLYQGVSALYKKICETSPFQRSFEKVHKCAHELKNDYDDCSGPADWNENPDRSKICKVYKEICDCFYIKTEKLCGKESGNIVKQLVIETFDSILTAKCDNIDRAIKVDDSEILIRKDDENHTIMVKLSKICMILIIFVQFLLN